MAALTADWTLHVITDRHLSGGRDQLDIIRLAIQGGATVVQLRDKDGPTRDMVELGRALRHLTRDLSVVFLVNDRVDVALALDADGAHVGQDDLPTDLARALLGPQRLLGVSAATPDEARAAQAAGADYVGTGTVYPTGTKADAGAPVGLVRLRDVARAVTIPVVAIGGIGPGRAGPCITHGAAGVAVISAIVAHPDPEAAARQLRQEMDAVRTRR